MVDQWIVGYLIGKNGETLKSLKDQTGAKIAIDQDPKDAGYSILRIGDHGSPENVRARQAINVKIQECQMLPKNYGKFIQFCYGLIDDSYWENCGPALMPAGCAAANAVLPAEPEDVMWVDQWMVLPLIGKGGDEMRKIREFTQARIVVDQSHKEDGYSLIRITPAASPSSAKAQKALHGRVADLQARPEHEGKQSQFYNPPTGEELSAWEALATDGGEVAPLADGCGGPMGGSGSMDSMGMTGKGGKGGGPMPCKGGGMCGKGCGGCCDMDSSMGASWKGGCNKGGNMDWNAGPDFGPMGMGDMGAGMGCMDGGGQMGCMGEMGSNMGCMDAGCKGGRPMGCMGDMGRNMGCMDGGCKGSGPMGCMGDMGQNIGSMGMGKGPMSDAGQNMGCMGGGCSSGPMGSGMRCMDGGGKGGCCGPPGGMCGMAPSVGYMDGGCKGGGPMGCMSDMGSNMGCMDNGKGGGPMGYMGQGMGCMSNACQGGGPMGGMGQGMGCMDSGCKGGGPMGSMSDFGMSGQSSPGFNGGNFVGKGGGGMETMMGQSGPLAGCGGGMPGFYG